MDDFAPELTRQNGSHPVQADSDASVSQLALDIPAACEQRSEPSSSKVQVGTLLLKRLTDHARLHKELLAFVSKAEHSVIVVECEVYYGSRILLSRCLQEANDLIVGRGLDIFIDIAGDCIPQGISIRKNLKNLKHARDEWRKARHSNGRIVFCSLMQLMLIIVKLLAYLAAIPLVRKLLRAAIFEWVPSLRAGWRRRKVEFGRWACTLGWLEVPA